ncbi:hypothetical protein DFH06DRAFT_1136548 [Mycena polygramma]|nr:hypothetical protein DFH06DRAFT_1136548 [Mycena polygramma]
MKGTNPFSRPNLTCQWFCGSDPDIRSIHPLKPLQVQRFLAIFDYADRRTLVQFQLNIRVLLTDRSYASDRWRGMCSQIPQLSLGSIDLHAYFPSHLGLNFPALGIVQETLDPLAAMLSREATSIELALERQDYLPIATSGSHWIEDMRTSNYLKFYHCKVEPSHNCFSFQVVSRRPQQDRTRLKRAQALSTPELCKFGRRPLDFDLTFIQEPQGYLTQHDESQADKFNTGTSTMPVFIQQLEPTPSRFKGLNAYHNLASSQAVARTWPQVSKSELTHTLKESKQCGALHVLRCKLYFVPGATRPSSMGLNSKLKWIQGGLEGRANLEERHTISEMRWKCYWTSGGLTKKATGWVVWSQLEPARDDLGNACTASQALNLTTTRVDGSESNQRISIQKERVRREQFNWSEEIDQNSSKGTNIDLPRTRAKLSSMKQTCRGHTNPRVYWMSEKPEYRRRRGQTNLEQVRVALSNGNGIELGK